uniref:Cytochrome b6/f complex subunit VI n=1 Tax=Selaginella lyallii TaxID=137159 RepID=A0A481ZJV8_9TRAC|nr:cytochrome b6/f complex subunit VI [Selaginella lyallii]QBL02121.1 cytochrome b6/f complex subunit VI [Selaginella lyallii]
MSTLLNHSGLLLAALISAPVFYIGLSKTRITQ